MGWLRFSSKLQGEDIPIEGRIIAIGVILIGHIKVWTVEDAVNLIEKNSGSHFASDLVHLFRAVLRSILDIKEMYSKSTV
jgi:putative two-component system response regulator